MKKIGVISDTHGLLRPEAIVALQGSEYIIHAGDIGKQEIIEKLSAIAPVTAVRGNIDKGEFSSQYEINETLKIEDTFIYMLHILEDLSLDPVAAGFQVVVSGHTHKAKLEHRDGILFLNPGSAGPKRFSLPVTVASLEIQGSVVKADVIELNV